ncbi:hypothetical protein ACJX0J_031440, partial [Zea mays]
MTDISLFHQNIIITIIAHQTNSIYCEMGNYLNIGLNLGLILWIYSDGQKIGSLCYMTTSQCKVTRHHCCMFMEIGQHPIVVCRLVGTNMEILVISDNNIIDDYLVTLDMMNRFFHGLDNLISIYNYHTALFLEYDALSHMNISLFVPYKRKAMMEHVPILKRIGDLGTKTLSSKGDSLVKGN